MTIPLPRLATIVCAGGVAAIAVARLVTGSTGSAQPRPLPFLQPHSCYRLTFPIVGAPNWRILEVREDGWIRAEVDAGPAAAQRERIWVNSAQIVTVRDARCSE